jgi:hypothetical protein
MSCYKERSRMLQTYRERPRNNFTSITHSAVCKIFTVSFKNAISDIWKSNRIVWQCQQSNSHTEAWFPGEDSPVSCEEVAGNAPETIWTLPIRHLMPPSVTETSFHRRRLQAQQATAKIVTWTDLNVSYTYNAWFVKYKRCQVRELLKAILEYF